MTNLKKYTNTFVTALFQIKNNKSIDFYLNNGIELLKTKEKFIIFCPFYIQQKIESLIKSNNLESTITFINIEITDFPTYKLYEKISDNITKQIIKHPKINEEFFICVCNKPWMVNYAINLNPYNSTHFAWIDFGIYNIAKTKIELPLIFRDKISLCYIHYRPKHIVLDYIWQSYGLCSLASTFFTGNIEYLQKYGKLFSDEIENVVNNGVNWADEQILQRVYAKYPEIFELYYGDYTSVLSNYYEITRDLESIIIFLINITYEAGEFDLFMKIAQKVINYLEKDKSNQYKLEFERKYKIVSTLMTSS